MKKLSAVYSIFMGVSMSGMWFMFYISDSIPEMETNPIELGMHVLAEITTAILLIIAGILIFKKKLLGDKLYLMASGMLLYTLIMSPGYFLEKNEVGFSFMFFIFLGVLIFVSIPYFKKQEK